MKYTGDLRNLGVGGGRQAVYDDRLRAFLCKSILKVDQG